MVWFATHKLLVTKDARPLLSNALVPNGEVPFTKVTVPEDMPEPDVSTVTVAMNVTMSSNCGIGNETTSVVAVCS